MQNNNTSINININVNTNLDELESIWVTRIIKMIDEWNKQRIFGFSVNGSYRGSAGNDENEKDNNNNKMVLALLMSHVIQDYWNIKNDKFIDKNKFDLKRIIKQLINKSYLNPNLILNWQSNEKTSNIITNKDYFIEIGRLGLELWLEIYTKHETYNTKENIVQWFEFIDKFATNDKHRAKYLKELIVGYPSINITKNIATCRAIDLFDFDFDRKVLKNQLGFNFQEYKEICSKIVAKDDEAYTQLLEGLKKYLDII